MAEKEESAVKAVGFMMGITLLGKILGLVRDQFLAANYSVGPEAVAFLTASRIPRIFFDAVFASAISASFIPVFNEYLEKKGKKEAFRLSNQFVTMVGVVTIVLTALGMIFAEPLARLFLAVEVDETTILLCSNLLRILFPTVIFTGIAFSFVGILQSMEEFGVPAAMSVASNLIIIFYYIFFNEKFGVYGLTIAFLIGWSMQAIIQIPSLWKKGYRFSLAFSWNDMGMKKIGILMLPVMVSTWIQPINIFINTKFASSIYDGAGVPAIEYSNNLYSIVVGVIVLSIANVIFPRLSRFTTNDEGEAFAKTISLTMKVMAFLLLPLMLGLMTLSEPIVRLVFERGDFDAFATGITSQALMFFSLGMIGFGVQTILSRAFYAKQDGKTPFYSGLASIIVNIILCVLLVEKMGVAGLALSSAVSSTVAAVWLLVPMAKKNKGIFSKELIIDVCKMAVSACIMAFLVVFLRNLFLKSMSDSLIINLLTVCVPAGVGFCFYMLATYLFGISESRQAFDFLGKFLKKFLKKDFK